MSGTDESGRRRGSLFDDLAGVAGGAFSVLAGLRQEMEAMARAQADAVVQRLELVRREELDAALEVARRAREAAEALEARITALEARLGAAPAPAAAEAAGAGSVASPEAVHPEPRGGTVPEGSPAAMASAGMPGTAPEERGG
ncbi:accessory factor UbiK family protein [Crenalkalicoccus roseus]|uniref:accessory factor UbiK family protein n=1 Tax=Crenalkalicoccus roseus TaxID=1485588 RepID=UPI001081039B|nr:accessory factor UbiK family protein [Crenalkalicoccus roseus]